MRIASFFLKGAYWSLALALWVEIFCISLALWLKLDHFVTVFYGLLVTTLLQIVLYKGAQLAYIHFKKHA